MLANVSNILFRVDSSSTIGTGHIMRDLVLAEQFSDANVIFATQELPGNINHKIKEKNYALENLNSNEIEELIDIIKKHSIDMIVIDHYGIDHDYEKALKEAMGITVFVLDDTYEKHYCDILLNHNIYADSPRYKTLVPENCELRCGINHTLLRDEFSSLELISHSIKYKKTIELFIAIGGTDHLNLNIDILKALESFQNIRVTVVTTTANMYLDELRSYVNEINNYDLFINASNIASMISKADIAIVAPGVIINEIIYLELPFITIQTAENQTYMTNYLKDKDCFVLDYFEKNNFLGNFSMLLNPKIYEKQYKKLQEMKRSSL